MAISGAYQWRKCTDINRENALFELLEGEIPILDVGFTDEGVFEVAFHPGIRGKVMGCDDLLMLLGEGRELAKQDR